MVDSLFGHFIFIRMSESSEVTSAAVSACIAAVSASVFPFAQF
jgi:hypothetical protein